MGQENLRASAAMLAIVLLAMLPLLPAASAAADADDVAWPRAVTFENFCRVGDGDQLRGFELHLLSEGVPARPVSAVYLQQPGGGLKKIPRGTVSAEGATVEVAINLEDDGAPKPFVRFRGNWAGHQLTGVFDFVDGRSENVVLEQRGNAPRRLAKCGEPQPRSPADAWWSADQSKAERRAFAKQVQEAVRADDAKGLSGLVQLPMTFCIGGQNRKVATRDQFVSRYRQIVDQDVRDAVLNQDLDNLFTNWRGSMFGDGQVWFDKFHSDSQALEAPGRIWILAIKGSAGRKLGKSC